MKRESPPIRIGGLTPLTTVDYPGKLAAVVFCQGCSWRCRYCHNPHLQSFSDPPEGDGITWERLMDFLSERVGFLDGVVFSGGEPTLQRNLPAAMQWVKKLGFAIGLHTAGPDPERLRDVLEWADWVGMDIKAPLDSRYAKITGIPVSQAGVLESLRLLIRSRVKYQIRTTVHPALLGPEDLEAIHRTLKLLGSSPTVAQSFRAEGCLDGELCRNFNPVTASMEKVQSQME